MVNGHDHKIISKARIDMKTTQNPDVGTHPTYAHISQLMTFQEVLEPEDITNNMHKPNKNNLHKIKPFFICSIISQTRYKPNANPLLRRITLTIKRGDCSCHLGYCQ
ncbi:hypothetical protein CsSME_00007582 [Camellia sinensis var. sinensis]